MTMFLFGRKLGFLFIAAMLVVGFSAAGIYAQEKVAPNQETEIKTLISQLYQTPWSGAEIVASPMEWDFGLTEPMTRILEIGQPAQDALLEKVGDPAIKAQVIFLLGGVGDEKSIAPIIDAMISAADYSKTPEAEKINQSANLALTNITVADVIWHHGGGIAVTKCPRTEKECWAKWWKVNKKTFTVKGITQSRRYSNYPGYGIYQGLN